MVAAELKPPRRTRLGLAALVAGLHVIVVGALMHAFAPQLDSVTLQPVLEAFDVALAKPPPPPSPPTPKNPVPEPQGAAAPAGKKARPREVAAPVPKIALSPAPAPVVASSGSADSAGASAAGDGTAAGGTGAGTGAGGSGSGTGGGTKAVKIAGDIVSARDYPAATRAQRLGTSVTVALTVGADGQVKSCRIVRPSHDAEADRITCRLATERFRFRPARNQAGQPVASVYGWQQRWFMPTKP
jgi:protein TonB